MLIHPLVVHLPVALWLTSAFFDLLAWWREDPFFRRAAYWLVGLGILGAAVSIAFGWVDFLAAEAQGVGPGLLIRHRVHSLVAYCASASYLGNFAWRWRTDNRLGKPLLALSFLGAILIAITGYLGGQLRNIM